MLLNQRRSYVLDPYTMVHDLRSGRQVADARAVLDGDIDAFLLDGLIADAEARISDRECERLGIYPATYD